MTSQKHAYDQPCFLSEMKKFYFSAIRRLSRLLCLPRKKGKSARDYVCTYQSLSFSGHITAQNIGCDTATMPNAIKYSSDHPHTGTYSG